MEGQGDLVVSRLKVRITHIVSLVIPNIDLFAKSPPPSNQQVSSLSGRMGLWAFYTK